MSDRNAPQSSSAAPATKRADPLTVLCSLLSRADDTPLGERTRATGHLLDHDGEPITDPPAHSSVNGFEPNPNLNFEHWGEYWRKVHGVRFVHVEEPDDRSLERLLRYDQLHRFAPGPTNTDAPPYAPPLDTAGRLWPTIIGHVAAYRRPKWDGIAYLNFAAAEDIAVVLANKRVQEKIAPEDRAMFRDIAPILSREYIVHPSATGAESVTLVKLHRRANGISRQAFHHWWLHEHAGVVLSNANGLIRRYAQLHNVGPTEAGQPLFHAVASQIDGVTLVGFTSVNDVEAYLESAEQREVTAHEHRMTDPTREEWWTAIGVVVVNRLGREQATRVDGDDGK